MQLYLSYVDLSYNNCPLMWHSYPHVFNLKEVKIVHREQSNQLQVYGNPRNIRKQEKCVHREAE